MKIVLEQKKCIGCGSCAALAHKYFKMNSKHKSELIKGKQIGDNFELEISNSKGVQDAVDACPAQCIHLK